MASATRILDRAAARIEVAQHVSPLIIRDIVDEGTGLLGRVNQTLGGGGTPPAAHRALLLLFRHAVELADGFDELIEEGVVTPAGLQVRAILEAHMQMLYVMGRRVQSPSANPIGKARDPVPRDASGAPIRGTTLLDALNERGEAYLVLETRRQLATAQLYRAGPLTAWFAETTGKSAVPGKTVDQQIQTQLAAEENRLHAMLAEAHRAPINAEYTRVRGTKHHDPNWFTLFGGPRSVRELSRSIGLAFQYDMLYAETSRTMHGVDVSGQLGPASATGVHSIAPLRDFRNLAYLVRSFMIHMVQIYALVIETLRPGDMPQHHQWVQRWLAPQLDVGT